MPSSIIDTKLNNTPFIYRDRLTIPKNVNFGLELELDKIDPDKVYKVVRSQIGRDWKIKDDKSLTKGQSAEIVSPVLQNNKETWIVLKKLSDILSKLKPNYDNCSFQVNFDGDCLPLENDKLQFLKLFAMYEDIIYRFSKGEDSEYRDSLDMYAAPIILLLKDCLLFYDSADVAIFQLSDNKKYGVVFKQENQDLIEFRTPNMTSNPILWQNYITTFYYLLKASVSDRYDKDVVDKYIEQFNKTYLLENYELEKREKAIEFSNMIFPHSIDKTYFMHQYLGDTPQKKYVLK